MGFELSHRVIDHVGVVWHVICTQSVIVLANPSATHRISSSLDVSWHARSSIGTQTHQKVYIGRQCWILSAFPRQRLGFAKLSASLQLQHSDFIAMTFARLRAHIE